MNHVSRFYFLYFVILSSFLLTGCRPGILSDQAADETIQYQHHHSRTERGEAPPQQIALLLPLSGKHAEPAKAIYAGFFASHYQTAAVGGRKPTVRIYDTATAKNIQQIYEEATQEGADLIVGPLAKEDVYRLSMLSRKHLEIPVLALNTHPQVHGSPDFIQFSLAPEAEAEQIADIARERGLRRASVIVPDNAWGKRIAQAFSRHWQMAGGQIVHTVYAHPQQDQSAAVKRLLGIDESQHRANEIKTLLAEKVTFQAKQHQNIDFIFMAAPPDQARQLKPLFDFYYAENIPVYATSSIYSGKPDRDLNGVIFCDMPWLLVPARQNAMQALINNRAGVYSDQYNRLFAMGADAYQLSMRLGHLEHHAVYPGATGDLSLDQHYLIQRRLVCAKITDGHPHSLP